ncbi:tyrosine-type recombinase/integrase [Microbacterium aurum]
MARKYKANREDFGAIRVRNGRFQASYPGPDGTRYYGPMTFSNRTDARAWLDGVRTDIARGVWVSPKAIKAETFAQYAETWIAQRLSSKGEPLRPKTRQEYERQLAKGLAVFADDRLTDITTARVREWHAARMKAGKTAAASEARLLRAILNTAAEDGIIAAAPVPSKLTNTSAGKKYRPPTIEELATLHDGVEDRYKLAVLIAAYGGLRLSEWRALRRADLTLTDDRYIVSVTRQAEHVTGHGWEVGPPKSASGVRVAALPAWMTPVIDAHLEARVGPFAESLLFAPKGRSQFIHNSDFYDSWTPAQEAAGVKGQVREHDLRDFAGSHLLAAGANALEVRDFLGHADVQTTTKHYLHVVNDRAAELADRMPTLPKPKTTNVTKLAAKIGN